MFRERAKERATESQREPQKFSLALSGSLWLSLTLSDSLWLPLALSGSLWLYLALSGSFWLFLSLSSSVSLSGFAHKALDWLTRPLLYPGLLHFIYILRSPPFQSVIFYKMKNYISHITITQNLWKFSQDFLTPRVSPPSYMCY